MQFDMASDPSITVKTTSRIYDSFVLLASVGRSKHKSTLCQGFFSFGVYANI